MKNDKRFIGMKLGFCAFMKGMPCMPDADIDLSRKKSNLSLLEKNQIINGWIDGWRTGELDSSGGW